MFSDASICFQESLELTKHFYDVERTQKMNCLINLIVIAMNESTLMLFIKYQTLHFVGI